MLQGSLRGCTSWITPETLTLQFGALRSISLQPMASNIPHSPAVEETQEPPEAIVGCVEFFLWRGERQGEFNVVFGFDIFLQFCGFRWFSYSFAVSNRPQYSPPPFVDSGDLITLSFSQCSDYMMYTRLYANTFTGHALLTIHSLHRKEKLRIMTFVSPRRQYCVSSSTKQRRKIDT